MIRESHSPPGKRARRRTARTQEILSAALGLVASGGMEHLTIARVADEVDAAVGALYRYFPGKDELIAALEGTAVDAVGEAMGEHSRRASAAAAADSWERAEVLALVPIVASAHAVLRFADNEPDVFRLVRAGGGPNEARARMLAQWEDLLSDAADAGALDDGDPEDRAEVLWDAVVGQRGRAQVDRLLGALFSAWGADSSDSRAAFRRT